VDGAPSLGLLGALIFVFFYGFNVLEASQPSIVTRLAPPGCRGSAIGVYNTLQSLGLFAGGVGGGWLMRHGGAHSLFSACAVLMLLWLVVAWPMAPIEGRVPAAMKAG
jgi:predicted MFS family arabinose efflux permease